VEIKVEQAKVVYVAVLFYIKSISIIDIISNISVRSSSIYTHPHTSCICCFTYLLIINSRAPFLYQIFYLLFDINRFWKKEELRKWLVINTPKTVFEALSTKLIRTQKTPPFAFGSLDNKTLVLVNIHFFVHRNRHFRLENPYNLKKFI
jgi:hypothetical protein